ncbi:MAG: SMC-Scp complex subunit ScpB [Chloroflexi bacterium]|uniref:SMC-Scp complex subunit ScpB n=2 Tax=Candidatus Thermofonsia Clade 3 TaxID=2364209 RepID=A0A2M8QBN0_9CHLR|nr:MAG: SMC-Scp complex subunit ScpB [Candidatus Thermofonsia Clade 3 bacterium]RMG64521.1 MAG: SMC-Scp complex subunit ScpB [Chloroflexota bacterium]
METREPVTAVVSTATEADPAEVPLPLSLAAQLESLLYVASEPATLNALAATLDATPGEIEAALEELSAQYQARGIRLQRLGNRVRLVTAPEMGARIQKFLGLEEVNRLSQAALETLAIIAYNQPITKPQLEAIRGVNCDGVINTLLARNLVQELGRADTVGHPMRYGVSFDFLNHFGLRGVHELPAVERLDTLPLSRTEQEAAAGASTSDSEADPTTPPPLDADR